jgi:hypothetical protein
MVDLIIESKPHQMVLWNNYGSGTWGTWGYAAELTWSDPTLLKIAVDVFQSRPSRPYGHITYTKKSCGWFRRELTGVVISAESEKKLKIRIAFFYDVVRDILKMHSTTSFTCETMGQETVITARKVDMGLSLVCR